MDMLTGEQGTPPLPSNLPQDALHGQPGSADPGNSDGMPQRPRDDASTQVLQHSSNGASGTGAGPWAQANPAAGLPNFAYSTSGGRRGNGGSAAAGGASSHSSGAVAAPGHTHISHDVSGQVADNTQSSYFCCFCVPY